MFSTIALMGKYTNPEVHSTLASLIAFIQSHNIKVVMEKEWLQHIPELQNTPLVKDIKEYPLKELGQHCDCAIVVGGDGSFLSAARAMVDYDVPLIGVNRGQRGFLTDISPQVLTQSLEPILKGEYLEEKRFLLDMRLIRNKKSIQASTALNEVVLYSGDVAKMIEFEVRIDGQMVYRQRSDGLIAATPTGSTAYALSGGGPIVHPTLEAIVLVPMHPPMLSSRPIVLKSDMNIELHLVPENTFMPRLSCDGQVHFDMEPDDRVEIKRKAKELRVLHPKDYDYYFTLRSKLKWSS